MHLFLVVAVPLIVILGVRAIPAYLRFRRPAPLALGSAFPILCVVSSDEIRDYYKNNEENEFARGHLRHEVSSQRAEVSRRYAGQMVLNATTFLRVTRFEKLKIDPHKSSLDYEQRETLILRLVDEASAVRWLLVRAQTRMAVTAWIGVRISQKTMKTLLAEYKHLEQDFVALVAMAADDAYYSMLVERLGLSNWRLMEGGASGPTA